MIINRNIFGCSALLWALAGCSPHATIDELKRDQQSNKQLLQQQFSRMEVQEESLAQLAESQLEMATHLAKINEIITQMSAGLPQVPGTGANEGLRDVALGDQAETSNGTTAATKEVVGRNEWVWFELLNRNLKARVDTGALSSSLSATELQPFERDGREWIRFRVPDEDHPDGGEIFETQLVKYVKIRQASASKLKRRPVVRLKIRMGELVDETEFSLTSRENMLYPVLLGRNFLRDVAVVDVAKKFTQPKYVAPDTVSLQP